MTPAPHVPVNFLKAGGSAFFSAVCIALLAELGYDADEFGTYEHVASKLADARKKCRDYDQWVADGKPARDPEPAMPTRRERELGRPMSDPDHYEAGHLGRNSCMQTTRGDACSNAVLGHEVDQYPCMPHQGSAIDPASEHNQVTVYEEDAPRQRAQRDRAAQEQRGMPVPAGDVSRHGDAEEGEESRPRSSYDHETMEADADRRNDEMIRRREERKEKEGEAYGLGDDAWSQRDNAGGEVGTADAGDGRMTDDATGKSYEKIDGDTAAECINNYRRGAVSGLRSHASADQTIADREAEAKRLNDEAAALRADQDHMQRLEDAATRQENAAEALEQAHQDRVAAGNAMGGARRSNNHWEAACAPPNTPTDAQIRRRDESRAHLANTEAQHAQASADEQAARDEQTSANRSRGAMRDPDRMEAQARQQQCLADQGREIRDSPNPNHGRNGVIPSRGSAPRSGGTGSASSASTP